MSILTQSESQHRGQRKLEEIAIVLRVVRCVSRRCLELTIQGLLNRWVTAGLAGDPLEPAPSLGATGYLPTDAETDKRTMTSATRLSVFLSVGRDRVLSHSLRAEFVDIWTPAMLV
jgi:hypothetical protein